MGSIILKFAVPLQSWGTDSNSNTRNTDYHPSKSAVIGMIAACMGYSRNEDERIQNLNDLSFATRVDQQGKLLRDFQIAKKSGAKYPYVTNRYYIQDAIYIVGIGSDDEKLLNDVLTGLQNPHYQPYYGRKSNPVNADLILCKTEKNVLESILTYKWQASDWYKSKLRYRRTIDLDVYADAHLIPDEPFTLTRDAAQSFSQKSRVHEHRPIVTTTVTVSNPYFKESTSHDVFLEIGE